MISWKGIEIVCEIKRQLHLIGQSEFVQIEFEYVVILAMAHVLVLVYLAMIDELFVFEHEML